MRPAYYLENWRGLPPEVHKLPEQRSAIVESARSAQSICRVTNAIFWVDGTLLLLNCFNEQIGFVEPALVAQFAAEA